MQIRTYKETDETQVIDLWTRCNLVAPTNDPAKDIQRKLEVDRNLFLVGIIADKLIATVMGGYEGHRGWVNYLAVDPNFRRQGYGKKIMLAVEKHIRSRGCPKINLQVRSSNRQVIDFYRSIGFFDDDVLSLGKRLVED